MTNEKKVTELQSGDYVVHMFGIKQVLFTFPSSCNLIYVKFTDGSWSEIEILKSLQLASDVKGDTLEEKKFHFSMEMHRKTTLGMAGFPNEVILAPEMISLLDAYEAAYQKMYKEKWGLKGPNGSVLRMEEEEETTTREEWEKAVLEYWRYVDSQEYDDDIGNTIIVDFSE